MMKTKIFLAALVLLMAMACKKDKKEDKRSGSERIVRITDNMNPDQIFGYDNEKRLTRVTTVGSGSLQVTYQPTSILMQYHDAMGAPIPNKKYEFTLANGRIVKGYEYDGAANIREYIYTYNNNGQLFGMEVNKRSSVGLIFSTQSFSFTYDGQGNMVRMETKIRNGIPLRNSDSGYVTKEYHEGKPFFRWADVGFDYFGTTPMSQTRPISSDDPTAPFFLVSYFFPSRLASKLRKGENYKWDNVTQKWVFASSFTTMLGEDNYLYDQQGRLIRIKPDINIHWQ